jgi:predicted acylesterase/phospholipase RssA
VYDRIDHAFVLTGNGANAAYEVGIMKAVLKENWGKDGNPPIDPYCFAGTSFGAFNGAVMVSLAGCNPKDAIGSLEQIWLDRIAADSAGSSNGLFRIRAEPTQYLSVESLRNPVKPLLEMTADMLHFGQQTVRRVGWAVAASTTMVDGAIHFSEVNEWLDITPVTGLVRSSIDRAKVARSPKRLRITAANWTEGTPHVFENADFAKEEAHQIVMAALAIPGIVPAQQVGGLPFVDGSVFVDAPLQPAVKARPESPGGAVVLHTVYVDADKVKIPLPALSNTFSTIYRLYMLALSRAVKVDLERAKIANERIRTREMFDTIRKQQSLSEEAKHLLDDLTNDVPDTGLVTIHRYCPTKYIHGFELHQFERESIRQLIQHGYEDALNHDCAASGCILSGENVN